MSTSARCRAALRALALLMGILLIGTGSPYRAHELESDPFQFLSPWIVVSASERTRLDRDEVIARILPGHERQIGVFVATRLNAPPEALATWTRAIVELKRSKFVQAVGRISAPPEPADFDALVLDDRDLDAIRQCVVRDCSIRLSAAEIATLRQAIDSAGPEWRGATQREFRRLLLDRVRVYRKTGLAGLPPFAHSRSVARPADVFAGLLERSPYLRRDLPTVARWLASSPPVVPPGVESFLYWSKEHYGVGKPVISMTHVGIVHPPATDSGLVVLVTGKQVFSTHYIDGALGLTMVLRDARTDHQYLVYINRTQLDLVKGFFGGIIRSILERRVKRDAPGIARALRARLESGGPHPTTGSP